MNRVVAGGLALASVVAGKAAIACRLRRPAEGWRRTVGILLRSEPTRFAVSAFGLHVPGAAPGDPPDRIHVLAADALRQYLARTSDAHFALEWRWTVTVRRRIASVAVALLEFAGNEVFCTDATLSTPLPTLGAPVENRPLAPLLPADATTTTPFCTSSDETAASGESGNVLKASPMLMLTTRAPSL